MFDEPFKDLKKILIDDLNERKKKCKGRLKMHTIRQCKVRNKMHTIKYKQFGIYTFTQIIFQKM